MATLPDGTTLTDLVAKGPGTPIAEEYLSGVEYRPPMNDEQLTGAELSREFVRNNSREEARKGYVVYQNGSPPQLFESREDAMEAAAQVRDYTKEPFVMSPYERQEANKIGDSVREAGLTDEEKSEFLGAVSNLGVVSNEGLQKTLNGSVATDQIRDGSITDDQMRGGSITDDQMRGGSITDDQMPPPIDPIAVSEPAPAPPRPTRVMERGQSGVRRRIDPPRGTR